MRYFVAAGLAMLLFAGPAAAAITRIPSCYAALHMVQPAGNQTKLFVLIDQTVVLDQALKNSLLQNALSLARPGNAFEVMVFSAYNQGRYMDVAAGGALEAPLPAARRNAIGAEDLQTLDTCLGRQLDYGRRLMAGAVAKSLNSASSSLSRSEVIGSLAEAGHHIRDDPAQRKIVLIASDMLENSAVTSFYRKSGVRTIVPGEELRKVQAAGMLGDFGGADVYVVGAAMLPLANASAETDATMQTYRSAVTLRALQDFWNLYFQNSKARLVEFGEPALLTPVR